MYLYFNLLSTIPQNLLSNDENDLFPDTLNQDVKTSREFSAAILDHTIKMTP